MDISISLLSVGWVACPVHILSRRTRSPGPDGCPLRLPGKGFPDQGLSTPSTHVRLE